ncbi:MAG: 50S ribosomal protein L6 [Patescibacteria group bacterium]
MSKIGKQPVKIPEGVRAEIQENKIVLRKDDREAFIPVLRGVKAILEEGELRFSLESKSKQSRSNWGTVRSLTNNAAIGLTKGFEKNLILEGVGYRITKEGNNLSLNLGFSHQLKFEAPPGITFEVEKNSILKIKGIDKFLVGQVAAQIRSLKKPEPYKGKGFRYSGEVIRRKAGKKAVATMGGGA